MQVSAITTLALMMAVSTGGAAEREAVAERAHQALDLEVIHAPAPVRIDGREMLFYELHATSFASTKLTLRAIEVIDSDGRTVATLDPQTAVRQIGENADKNGSAMAPGQRSIIYATFPWIPGRSAHLRHRLVYDTETSKGVDRVSVTGGDTTIADTNAPTLGAPLRGGPWTAVYAPEMDFGHRRYVYAVHGRARVPGRLAIDWMPAKGFAPASAGSKVSVQGNGADILAVADATVAVVKQVPRPGQRGDIEDETGAMIVLDLGGGRFAFYEHLAAGLLVRPGQTVVRGQVIARLGATGHVSQPHLHFHIADGTAPLSSEGLPYRLAAGTIIGAYDSIEAFGAGGDWRRSAARRMDDFPPANAVVAFD